MSGTQSELRLARLIDEREHTQTLHEGKLADIEKRDDKMLSDADQAQVTAYRERITTLDSEIRELAETVEANNKALEQSQKIRRALAGTAGVDEDGDGIVYRTMAEYARDVVITGNGREASKIKGILGDNAEIDRAESRLQLLKRTPANTLSANVAGSDAAAAHRPDLPGHQRQPPSGRVGAADRPDPWRHLATRGSTRSRSSLSRRHRRPRPATPAWRSACRPPPPSTYLGGGDLSWQAINWSTPNALDLWFRLAAADYALKTEQDAAQVLQHSAFSNNIASTLAATPTFAQFMTAVGAGYAEVFANTGRLADTIYMAPDRFGYLLGLTSDAFTQFVSASARPVSGRCPSWCRAAWTPVSSWSATGPASSSPRPLAPPSSSVSWSPPSVASRSGSSARSRPSPSTTAPSRC